MGCPGSNQRRSFRRTKAFQYFNNLIRNYCIIPCKLHFDMAGQDPVGVWCHLGAAARDLAQLLLAQKRVKRIFKHVTAIHGHHARIKFRYEL